MDRRACSKTGRSAARNAVRGPLAVAVVTVRLVEVIEFHLRAEAAVIFETRLTRVTRQPVEREVLVNLVVDLHIGRRPALNASSTVVIDVVKVIPATGG